MLYKSVNYFNFPHFCDQSSAGQPFLVPFKYDKVQIEIEMRFIRKKITTLCMDLFERF